MLEALELTRDFGSLRAVDAVSFHVHRGEAVGFLGPNGAGKTTTFRMLSGSLGPTSGRVLVGGHDLGKAPGLAKRQIGYMPENAPLYPEMTPREYLRFRAELEGAPRRTERERSIGDTAELVHVKRVLDTRIGALSKGYRQRVALAATLLGDPPLLLLDEPTAGLDPNQVDDVRALIRRLSEDHAVLLSTHVLSEVEATCSRAIVIHEGRIAGDIAVEAGALERDFRRLTRTE